MDINNKYLLSINFVTQGNRVLNKNQIPVILFTENPEKSVIDICNNETYIGGSIFDFCTSNILAQAVIENTPDIYSTAYIKYIYYHDKNKETVTGSFSVQSVVPLKHHNCNDSDDEHNIYITQLYYYYIHHALIDIYNNVANEHIANNYEYSNAPKYINNIIRKLINDYDLNTISILNKLKKIFKDKYKLNDKNTNELMLYFKP